MAMKARGRIKILVVDDHPVVRRGIITALISSPELEVVGEAPDGESALRMARELGAEVVMLDIDLPGTNGLDVAKALQAEFPDIKIIILSLFACEGHIMQAIRTGVQGCLPKQAPVDELVTAIKTVINGQPYFSEDVARVALGRMVKNGHSAPTPDDLTTREREVLVQIAEGMSNKEIASHLGLGVRTVETHRDRLMRKLGIHSVAGLTKFAIRHGLSSIGETVHA
jgi:two-component system nitrate/nitrite response regulator NarL